MQTLHNAIMQAHRPDFVSNNYGFIQTKPIIDLVASEGWQLIKTEVRKSKTLEKQGYTKHRLIFEHPTLGNDGDSKPRLYLLNSHDRSSAFSFNLGFFRFICDNGLIIGDALGQSFKVFHSGRNLQESVYSQLYSTLKAVPKTLELRDNMRSLLLSSEDESRLVNRLNFVVADFRGLELHSMQSMHQVRRLEDRGNDVWSIFNACQETAINGGFYAAKLSKPGEPIRRHQKARSIKAIDSDTKLNKLLFDETIKFMSEVCHA